MLGCSLRNCPWQVGLVWALSLWSSERGATLSKAFSNALWASRTVEKSYRDMAECSTASTLRSWPFPLQSCISTPCNCLPDSPSVYHGHSEWRESSRCIFAFKRRLSTSHAAMQTTSRRHANGPARCLNDFAVQSQPFCNVISAVLAPNMAEIVRQYG